MKNKKLIVHIAGGSCTGKSTLARALSEIMRDFYIVSYDRLKRGLRGYNREKHKPLVKRLVRGFFEVACQQNLTIILDTFINTKAEYEAFSKISKKYGYKIITMKLAAPISVLTKRFRERIREVEEKGKKISVMDEGLFLKNQTKRFYVPKDAHDFDTSKEDINQILEKILKIIN